MIYLKIEHNAKGFKIDTNEKKSKEKIEPEPGKYDFLKEYELAQQSAQHHDNISWIFSSIFIGGMLVLFGLIFNKENIILTNRVLFGFICIMGVFINIIILIFHWRWSEIIKHNYSICKKIEEMIGMERIHSNSIFPQGIMKILFTMLITFFISIWILAFLIYFPCL